jgi:exodeoxyribonuclease V gamma subunit
MALHLNISNSLKSLADRLCNDLRERPGTVFQPQYIVTQTEGMNVWLKFQIAECNGIAANNLFLSPNDIIQKIYYFLGGQRASSLTPRNLKWILYALLGEKDFIQKYPTVSSYYHYEGEDKDLKRLGLAEKTADLFDQYQIYRTDWINAWNENSMAGVEGESWQEHLWFRAKALVKERLPDKTVMGKHITDALKDPAKRQRLCNRLPALHLFGLSIITDYHLDLLYQVAESCNVHFYLTNPAPEVYWFEDRTEKQMAYLIKKGFREPDEKSQGNALLTSWGRVIQDTFLMLFKNEVLLNDVQETGLDQPGTQSLLKKIQEDIYNAASPEVRNPVEVADLHDGSIVINSCFTIRREVEVLYNYLVHLVDKEGAVLSPRDIVVMATDIDAYAPYIRAVFQNAPYKFKFTIADESVAEGDTVLSAVAALLTIDRRSFKAEEVLQLLDFKFIRRRFGITDPERLRKVVDAANIRFGIDGDSADDTRFVSWEYGIKRIMYGLAMSGGEAFTDPSGETIFPLDMVEGSESFELVRFCYFVQKLIEDLRERTHDRPIALWVEYVERLVQNMICEPDQEQDDELDFLQKQLRDFNVAGEFMQEELPFEIFSRSLLQIIASGSRSGSFASGGITFCSLIPMRSIPFKVVALLGLNFDKFPRKETSPSFNLMENDKRRRGDRNVKDNDKHLFLDTILSAQEFLYMSYLGQSVKDNSNIPPSALVDELVDYIELGFEEEMELRKTFIIKHPLHQFSTKYLDESGGLYNYLSRQEMKRRQVESLAQTIAAPDFTEITLKSIIDFAKHPVKTYYNRVLGINYQSKETLLSETELFELDGLQQWALKQELLLQGTPNVVSRQQEKVMKGELPLKNMAGVTIQDLDSTLGEAKKLLEDLVGNKVATSRDVEITIDGSLLRGTLQPIYDNELIFVSYSKKEFKYLVESYLLHLLASACSAGLPVQFVSTTQQKVFIAKPVAKLDAINRLTAIVQLYKYAHTVAIPFMPEWKDAVKPGEPIDEAKYREQVDKYFTGWHANPDSYMLAENANGSLAEAESFAKFERTASLLILPLYDMYPDYFTAKK